MWMLIWKNITRRRNQSVLTVTITMLSSLQSQLSITMKLMFLLWLASALIGGLSLSGRFNALARERKKEIDLLRAIGVKKRQVFGLILGETCTMALIGGILGSGFTLICMEPVIQMLKDAFMLSPSVWDGSMSAFCAGCGVLTDIPKENREILDAVPKG